MACNVHFTIDRDFSCVRNNHINWVDPPMHTFAHNQKQWYILLFQPIRGLHMKQAKKRFTVTMDSDLLLTLETYSAVSGLTKSEIIEGWLREASPALEGLIELYAKIETVSESDLDQIQAVLEGLGAKHE